MDNKDLVSILGARYTLLLHAITTGNYFSYRSKFDIVPCIHNVHRP